VWSYVQPERHFEKRCAGLNNQVFASLRPQTLHVILKIWTWHKWHNNKKMLATSSLYNTPHVLRTFDLQMYFHGDVIEKYGLYPFNISATSLNLTLIPWTPYTAQTLRYKRHFVVMQCNCTMFQMVTKYPVSIKHGSSLPCWLQSATWLHPKPLESNINPHASQR